MHSSWENAVADYCSSQHFFFLDDGLKEHAESVLNYWAGQIPATASIEFAEKRLFEMARLDLPLAVRKAIPSLLGEFLEYAESTGKPIDAPTWREYVSLCEKKFTASFRNDGSVRGATITNRASETRRNDPCPCGSGLKFKKCCLKLNL
ncbi:MAG: hypothetical protein GF398_19435 [Chitinivibrionales bacterium]|nr:hypothetical protein [Chitinivibrionales bacterium]